MIALFVYFLVFIGPFILAGLILFAIAERISNRKAKVCLRVIAIMAGPVFFLTVAIFSGWEREKTYEMQWLIGRPAEEYLGYDKSGANGFTTSPLRKKQEEIVVLKRNVGDNQECFESYASSALAQYLEGLPIDTIKVRYKVTYDFFRPRAYWPESIGDFGGEAAEQQEISLGAIGNGEERSHNSEGSCFSW